MASRRRLLRVLAVSRRQFRRWWWSHSGDWQWLTSKPIPVAGLNRLLWRESVPSLSFVVMLTLSSVLSTLGLLAGSTATVIGAMIIAPLMGPIIGMAYAIAVANRRLIKRAGLTLIFGTLVTVVSATVICHVTGLRSLTEEIVLRTEPTLIDLVVAMAAGRRGPLPNPASMWPIPFQGWRSPSPCSPPERDRHWHCPGGCHRGLGIDPTVPHQPDRDHL
jgi:hypothetical protein